MKVKIFIALVTIAIFLDTNILLAISDNKNLMIKFTVSPKSKLSLNTTDIRLSDDPEYNATILADKMNVISSIKTGGVNLSSLEASTELINNNGDVIPLDKKVASINNKMNGVDWKKLNDNFFQADIFDTLIMNLEYKNNNTGPYWAIIKYTLVTP